MRRPPSGSGACSCRPPTATSTRCGRTATSTGASRPGPGDTSTRRPRSASRPGPGRWKKAARGPILGSATIVGDTVYFSTLAARMTYGVRTRDGKDQFHRGQGAFDPAIADERHLYLIGYSTITALEPKAGGEGAGGGAGEGARDHRGRSTR